MATRGPAKRSGEGLPGRSPTTRSEVPLAPVRVAIVGAPVPAGTRHLLEAVPDLQIVGEARTAGKGGGLLRRLRPDVALVDIDLPDMGALELARTIARRHPEVRVLAASAYEDYAHVAEVLELGVDGYLLKTASAEELADALRAVAGGVFVLDRLLASRLARRRWGGPGGAGALTSREADVLRLLARGLSNKKIASELSLGLRTVEGHVSSILMKLGATSRTEAVLYGLSHHLVTTEDHHDTPRSPD